MLPKISIIIPHLNQETLLKRCLSSLVPQFQPGEVEIIVVDNGSHQLPRETVEQFHGTILQQEDIPGPGPARNRGIAVSKANILAFIDADCVADAKWISAIRAKLLASSNNEIVGGDVRIALDDPDNVTVLEAYESVYAYRQEEYIKKMGFSGTGNLAMLRSVYDDVGPFKGIQVAEDRDWGQRAKKLGHTISFVPEMVVYHPARKSFDELYRKWDRHIAHDFGNYLGRPLGSAKWISRAIAVAMSPMVETVRILRSQRLSGFSQRADAFYGLVRIRLYRTKRMLQVCFHSDAINTETWNRK